LSKMTPCFDEPALKLPKLICKFDFVIPKWVKFDRVFTIMQHQHFTANNKICNLD
jgi:hypothetical protein